MRHILDPKFKYRKAVDTDIAATFKRIRAEHQKNAAEVVAKVKTLTKAKAA